MDDLWPNDISLKDSKTKAPYTILKEQASFLSQKTKNLIEAEVIAQEGSELSSKDERTLLNTV